MRPYTVFDYRSTDSSLVLVVGTLIVIGTGRLAVNYNCNEWFIFFALLGVAVAVFGKTSHALVRQVATPTIGIRARETHVQRDQRSKRQ